MAEKIKGLFSNGSAWLKFGIFIVGSVFGAGASIFSIASTYGQDKQRLATVEKVAVANKANIETNKKIMNQQLVFGIKSMQTLNDNITVIAVTMKIPRSELKDLDIQVPEILQ